MFEFTACYTANMPDYAFEKIVQETIGVDSYDAGFFFDGETRTGERDMEFSFGTREDAEIARKKALRFARLRVSGVEEFNLEDDES